jgi:hypothetical protein
MRSGAGLKTLPRFVCTRIAHLNDDSNNYRNLCALKHLQVIDFPIPV